MKTKLHYVFTLAVLLIGFSVFGQTKFWQKSTSNGSLNTIPISELNEKHYEVFQLDFVAFRQALVNAPLRESNQVSTTFINVPNEEGVLETFRMLEAPVFDAELSAQFVVSALVSAALFWIVLGGVSGFFFQRMMDLDQTPSYNIS